jgi:meso-butanediol dehydrogenase / (S,S)-butanediol dehydrogenase / diacetyl reductase
LAAPVKGRVALVTGGGRGIGRAIAAALAAQGARVAICGRDAAALSGADLAVPADVGVEDDVRRLVARIGDELGPPEIVVNNAATAGPTLPLHEIDAEDFAAVLRANLLGPFLVSKHTLPAMLAAGRGAIVNIGSIAGVEAYPLRSPYAASKWGLVGLTRTLAAEVGPHGVRVNLVSPGPTEGDRADRVIASRASATGVAVTDLRARYAAEIPLRRFVTPDEVAAAVIFLASDAASGITGQTFCVSGGIEI